MIDTTYRGYRRPDRTVCVMAGGTELLPGPSQAIRNHSPNGFEWGYGGSGPAQLSLALLLHATDGDRERAELHYQNFKWCFVAGWKSNSWQVTRAEIVAWLDRAEGGVS